MELFREVVVLISQLCKRLSVGGAGGERLDAFAEGFEGAGDLGVLGWVWGEGEGDGALPLEEGEFNVVRQEE